MTQTSPPLRQPLNHLSVPVRNLDEAERFFTSAFGFERLDRKGEAILVLGDHHGFTLVLSQPAAHVVDGLTLPETFHFGFFVSGREDVDTMHRALADGGHSPGPAPKVSHSRYGFYFRALDLLLLEVSTPA